MALKNYFLLNKPTIKLREFFVLVLSVAFILFWLYAIYAKAGDFAEFKREMYGQVFTRSVAAVLPYVLPAAWLAIGAMLVPDRTRLFGMLSSFLMLLAFTVYVGLAVFKVYRHTPCDCAGLFDFNWAEQLYFNLFVTAVAAAGLILTFKDQERRKAVWTE